MDERSKPDQWRLLGGSFGWWRELYPTEPCVHGRLLVEPCDVCDREIVAVRELTMPDHPIPMRLPCESCGKLHIDVGEFATRHHHTHSCQHCGLTWRPAVVHTVGVRFLPGFKNEEAPDDA
jgi:hypothetical protein